ncbi:hypothetical protein FLAN108750_04660 [Flavobacterium antarcticum]|uniref:hypothetical protein n=1 Tax=Flavobacterium antarcticum TaxID=271155 RepID=UPI0003B48B18|nr:hypothetical protein [Flavobacterium antarcticum]
MVKLETLYQANILKVLYAGFSPRNVIKRLFNEQLTSDAAFEEAEAILWDLKTDDNINYEIVTSKYWLDREDFAATSFSSEVSL